MNKKSGSGTGMFMMEMIMVVFFFILCASTCILVFAKSNHMSKLAKDTNQGVLAAESVAEVWKAEGVDGLRDRFAAVDMGTQAAVWEQGDCSIYWDLNWQTVGQPEGAAYAAGITWNTVEELSEAEVSVTRLDDGKDLISLIVKQYQGSRE